ncbi:ParB N-terminal domain-containing protein [Magnetovibrio sp. PR-2]|uniref:ParB N-terminal domain-containing protein n=1 Tax=Magnetovibrio sp. PR-2 TaxID=3120356 RepID=UPI002FCE221B
MKIKSIPLSDLAVNYANDRHGELVDDATAMEWLLKHRAEHMKNLAKDIVKEGEIYEPPLVHEEEGKYTVFDGNRRVTCLKLIDNPALTPTESWRDFFQERRADWKGTFPNNIQCQVEANKDRIDEILYRRHTGVANGVGQSPWDAEAKSNFVKRSGKKAKVNVAEEIEKNSKRPITLSLMLKSPVQTLIVSFHLKASEIVWGSL